MHQIAGTQRYFLVLIFVWSCSVEPSPASGLSSEIGNLKSALAGCVTDPGNTPEENADLLEGVDNINVKITHDGDVSWLGATVSGGVFNNDTVMINETLINHIIPKELGAEARFCAALNVLKHEYYHTSPATSNNPNTGVGGSVPGLAGVLTCEHLGLEWWQLEELKMKLAMELAKPDDPNDPEDGPDDGLTHGICLFKWHLYWKYFCPSLNANECVDDDGEGDCPNIGIPIGPGSWGLPADYCPDGCPPTGFSQWCHECVDILN